MIYPISCNIQGKIAIFIAMPAATSGGEDLQRNSSVMVQVFVTSDFQELINVSGSKAA
jgi:hypothetical protein